MKNAYKVAAGVAAALSLGLAAAAFAHPGHMGGGWGGGPGWGGGAGNGMRGGMGMGQGMMMHGGGGMGPGMRGDMGPGMRGGAGPGAMMRGGPAGGGIGQQLMTPEERTAMWDKMRSAKTPEERQQLALANRAEMEKRAKDKGITLPQGYGPHGGYGRNFTPPGATNR